MLFVSCVDVTFNFMPCHERTLCARMHQSCLAKRFEAMKAAVSDLICNGYAAEVLLKQVLTDTVGNKYLKVIW